MYTYNAAGVPRGFGVSAKGRAPAAGLSAPGVQVARSQPRSECSGQL